MNEPTQNFEGEDDDYFPIGLSFDVLTFSLNRFSFSLIYYSKLLDQFGVLDFAWEGRRTWSRALLAYNGRPYNEDTGKQYMFDTSHVTVDLLFMRFWIRKHKEIRP